MEPMFRASTPLPSLNRRQRRANAARSRSRARKHKLTSAQQNAVNKATDRFAAYGCDCCGAPAISGFPAFCVPNGTEFLVICCDCKTDQNLTPLVAVIPDALIDPWEENDRDWFTDNPERMLRVRESLPGELQAAAIDFNATIPTQLPGHLWVTVSYQIRPGERARSLRQVPHGTSIDGLSDLEIAARFLFECDLEAAEQRYDDVMARSSSSERADALIRRMPSRLSFFEEHFR
jgi:hypothetical protein